MRADRRIFILLAAAGIALAPLCAQSTTLLVSAASSLTDVLTSLRPAAEKAVGATIQFNFGGSGSLRKQIEEGAPVDVFFSAAAEDMDRLQASGLLGAGGRVDLLSNAIVLVGDPSLSPQAAATASTADLSRLLSGTKLLAIGNPDTVPAGRYAKQALQSLGLYSIVEGKLALGGTVREVLQFVQSGSAPLGVVFLTDAMSLKGEAALVVIFRFPASSLATPIVYPLAVIAASKNAKAAAAFVAFLQGREAEAAFEKAGFIIP